MTSGVVVINFEFSRAFSGDGDLGGCLSSSSVSVSSMVDPAIINVDWGDLYRQKRNNNIKISNITLLFFNRNFLYLCSIEP